MAGSQFLYLGNLSGKECKESGSGIADPLGLSIPNDSIVAYNKTDSSTKVSWWSTYGYQIKKYF